MSRASGSLIKARFEKLARMPRKRSSRRPSRRSMLLLRRRPRPRMPLSQLLLLLLLLLLLPRPPPPPRPSSLRSMPPSTNSSDDYRSGWSMSGTSGTCTSSFVPSRLDVLSGSTVLSSSSTVSYQPSTMSLSSSTWSLPPIVSVYVLFLHGPPSPSPLSTLMAGRPSLSSIALSILLPSIPSSG